MRNQHGACCRKHVELVDCPGSLREEEDPDRTRILDQLVQLPTEVLLVLRANNWQDKVYRLGWHENTRAPKKPPKHFQLKKPKKPKNGGLVLNMFVGIYFQKLVTPCRSFIFSMNKFFLPKSCHDGGNFSDDFDRLLMSRNTIFINRVQGKKLIKLVKYQI